MKLNCLIAFAGNSGVASSAAAFRLFGVRFGVWLFLGSAFLLTGGFGTAQRSSAQTASSQKAVATRAAPPINSAGREQIAVNNKDGLRYVYIQPGEFRMGCSEGDSACEPNERPPHDVQIGRGFWIGQTEVAQAAYNEVMIVNEPPSLFRGDSLPVERVTWEEASRYCAAVAMRLPTEAEWEYAARAGSRQLRYGELDQIAWYRDNSWRSRPTPGETHGAWGMLKNAWGWIVELHEDSFPAATSNASGNGRLTTKGEPDPSHCSTNILAPSRWAGRHRTPGVCTTCWVTYGNGPQITMTKISTSIRRR
mgnify:CR=1 FL=1